MVLKPSSYSIVVQYLVRIYRVYTVRAFSLYKYSMIRLLLYRILQRDVQYIL
jgi:hypothetical protein